MSPYWPIGNSPPVDVPTLSGGGHSPPPPRMLDPQLAAALPQDLAGGERGGGAQLPPGGRTVGGSWQNKSSWQARAGCGGTS